MILDAFRLDGRVALVTGAARGLGQGIARALAEAGAGVVAVDRLPLDETCEQISALGRPCKWLSHDLSGVTPELAGGIIQEGVTALGRMDILVNNAGIIRRRAALEVGPEEWDAVLAVNLTGTFYLAQAAARHFVANRQPGKVINMASMMSFQGGSQVPAYAATKSGIAGLTRALANEWAPRQINVNAIAPGYMATELTAALRDDPARGAAILGRIPAGRWGTPDDLAGAVVFLASDASAYLHGAIIPVDGGWLAW